MERNTLFYPSNAYMKATGFLIEYHEIHMRRPNAYRNAVELLLGSYMKIALLW